jgi:hypothetical protein
MTRGLLLSSDKDTKKRLWSCSGTIFCSWLFLYPGQISLCVVAITADLTCRSAVRRELSKPLHSTCDCISNPRTIAFSKFCLRPQYLTIHFLLGRPRDTKVEKSRPLALACMAAADDCGASEKAGSKTAMGLVVGPSVAVQNVPHAWRLAVTSSS